ncbi:MAG: efflux RND transporter periplasmic adaptor subunit [Humidesulfovibrio sp.]|uniref:efflux RND transporter periplasmic adaptor subunit n=1 Tax=Humidesulfovibrio sp. TaxID=2910988 RepID=UPI002732C48A|nr:efflux RND transporter periplasmic adaptor subunit [Humidesulfovibrio sp.]MDP2849095.1 efflux RND transporter periplasmic adaptor subunit [Humidesulfovibrio sp.]
MPKFKTAHLFALIIALATLPFFSACGGDKTAEPKTASAPTVRATLYDARECRSLPGEVRAQNSVVLSSKISGTVVEVMAAEGQVVEKGQAILRIDDTELRQRVQAVQSTAQQAGLERQALAARSALAKVNMERMQKLFAQQAISRDELDRASTEYQTLKKQEQAMGASAAAAGHQGAEARSLMGYSLVSAPFRGVLSRRYVDQGAFVSAGAPLAAIDDVQGGYELEAQADESLMSVVTKGMQVLGLVPSVSSQPFLTRLTTVVDRVDPATRTFKVRAAYNASTAPAAGAGNATQNATQAAQPNRPHAGMFGKVCVPMSQAKKLLIPSGSVRQRGELTTVLVVDDKSVLRLRLVKIGGAYLKADLDGQSYIVQAQSEALSDTSGAPGVLIEVLSGLTEGEILVNGGPETLREGDRIAVKP